MRTFFTLKCIRSFAFVIISLLGLGSVAQAQVSVTATAGTLGPTNYSTLSAAFAAVNAGTHQGAINISITASSVSETGACVLNGSGAGSASYTSVLIKPTIAATISGPTVSGRGLIELNGADNVTIDGSATVGGSSRDLTITNTAAQTVNFTSVIRLVTSTLILSTDNVSIKNCILIGNWTTFNASGNTSVTTTNNGIYAGGGGSTTSATTAPSVLSSNITNSASGQTFANLTISNNSINSCAKAIAVAGSATSVVPVLTITNNLIGNATAGSTNQVYLRGIFAQGFGSSTGSVISGNTIYVESFCGSSSTACYGPMGIDLGGLTSTSTAQNGTNLTVENNKILRVKQNNTGGFLAVGINLQVGNGIILQNNFISNILNIGLGNYSTSFGAQGIRVNAGTSHKIIHNSIHLNGTDAGSGNIITCISFSGVATTGVEVRNNIFSNTVTTSSTTSNVVDIFFTSAPTLAMGLVMNNNAYYTGSGSNAGIAQVTTTVSSSNLYTVANFNSIAATPSTNFRAITTVSTSTNDNASIASTSSAPFVSATDLHISSGLTPTQLESGGASVGLTSDIDNQTRPGPTGSANGGATAPDIGADEFDGVPLDLTPPTITYTALANTCVTGSRTLTATITDASGVPTSGAGLPVLYFKINAGAYTAVTASSLGGGSYSFSFGSAAVPGDLVSYYIVAQDGASTPNIAASPSTGTSGLTANPPAASTTPTSPSSYNLGFTLSGTYSVGIGQTYTTLTSAINAYNNNCLGGPVTFVLTDANYSASETFPITINANANASVTNTLTIKPTLSSTSISGTSTSGIIVLNGADYVTIDGSVSGVSNTVCPSTASTRDLTISNLSTSINSAVVWLQTTTGGNAATNNTISNCNIGGNSNTTTLFGIGSGSSSISTTSLGTNNNNNSYINNNISKTQYGIYSQGASAANKNSGTLIQQNLVNTAPPNNVRRAGVFVGFENNISIVGNNIDSIQSAATSEDVFGISLGTNAISTSTFTGNEVTNATIQKNVIGSIRHTNTYSAIGIYLAPASTGTNIVANNMISGVSANGTSGDFTAGIFVGGGAGSNTQILHNTVALVGSQSGGNDKSYCLAIGGSNPVVNIKNNILVNTLNNGSGKNYVLGLGFTTFTNISSNNNVVFVTNPSTLHFIGATGSISAPTDVNGFPVSGQDLNSIVTSPSFVSPSNLHLITTTNYSINAAGASGLLSDDIDCNLRNASTPDIGADEFTPDCSTAIGGTTSANQTFCNSGTPTITASGYSLYNGSNYQWYSSTNASDYPNGGSAISSATNPASLNPGTLATTTYFWLRVSCATNSSVAFSNMMTVTIVPALAGISVSSTSICNGQSATLTENGGTAISQLWSTSAITASITVSPNATTTYTVTTTSASSCISTTSITIVVKNPSAPSTVAITAPCNATSVTLPNNSSTSATSTTVTYPNAVGCDSVVTYNITYRTGSTNTVAITAPCNATSVTLPNNSSTSATSATVTYPNAVGCDSVVTYNITYRTSSTNMVAITAPCNATSVTLPNNSTTSLTSTTVTYPNAAGCDSVVTYNITYRTGSTNTVAITSLCNATSVTLPDNSSTSATSATIVYPNAVGCDSVVTYNITYRTSSTNTVAVTSLCNATSVTLPDNSSTSATSATIVYPNAAGCDSVVTYNITYRTSSANTVALTAPCNASSVTLPNNSSTSATSATVTYPNAVGCDSVVTYNITYRNASAPSTVQLTAACNATSIVLPNGSSASSTNTSVIYVNAVGCDSVVTYLITYSSSSTPSTIAVSGCKPVILPNLTPVLNSGNVTVVYTNLAGCDSVVTYAVTVFPTYTHVFFDAASFTYELPWDTLVAQIGSYSHLYSTAQGCDSLVTFNISITNSGVGINLCAKVFLSGPYNTANGLMNDNLRTLNLIPTSEPYSSAPYNSIFTHLNGGGGESTSPAYLNTSGNNAIVDWVFIQLRDKTNINNVLATKSALLQRDGDIVDASDAFSPVYFANAVPDNYYVSVRHRNHLGVTTANTYQLSLSTANCLNFSSSALPLYMRPSPNNNPSPLTGATRNQGGVRTLYAGNCNIDVVSNAHRFISYNGLLSSDRAALSLATGATATINGYTIFDLDMNGYARFNGTNPDRMVILSNCANSNIITVNEQMPN